MVARRPTTWKNNPKTQTELPFIDSFAAEILHARNRHEILAVPDEVVRRGEVRMVGEVERLQAELHSEAIGDGKLAQYPEVPVEDTRPAQGVVAAGTEPRSGPRIRALAACLEDDAETQPELPLVDAFPCEILHASDRHEVRAIADVVVGDSEVRMVREVERLHAELQLHVV